MWTLRLLAAAALACLSAPACATPPPQQQQDVVEWLRAREGNSNSPGVEQSRYDLAMADLNGDGRDEALVYLRSHGYCGSGGCDFSILTPEGNSWRVVTDMAITRLPIRLLETSSHGWRDIAVTVGGGGLRPHEVILSFDGASYPDNPTVEPARPAEGRPAGRILIAADSEGHLLFP